MDTFQVDHLVFIAFHHLTWHVSSQGHVPKSEQVLRSSCWRFNVFALTPFFSTCGRFKENMKKECEEEASLPSSLSRKIRPTGQVRPT